MQTSYRINNLDPFAHDQRNGKATVVLCHINKDIWQQEMLRKRSGAAMNWHVYKGPDSEYIRQMLSTNLVESTNKRGQVVREWKVAGHKQDHFWDCETYCLALAHIYGLTGAKAKQRDFIPTIAVSDRSSTLRQMCLFWGITPLAGAPQDLDRDLIPFIDQWGRAEGILQPRDRVVFIAGTKVRADAHNQLVVHEVE